MVIDRCVKQHTLRDKNMTVFEISKFNAQR